MADGEIYGVFRLGLERRYCATLRFLIPNRYFERLKWDWRQDVIGEIWDVVNRLRMN
jgi:hypothetical protein